jgi:hypothetical protein
MCISLESVSNEKFLRLPDPLRVEEGRKNFAAAAHLFNIRFLRFAEPLDY